MSNPYHMFPEILWFCFRNMGHIRLLIWLFSTKITLTAQFREMHPKNYLWFILQKCDAGSFQGLEKYQHIKLYFIIYDTDRNEREGINNLEWVDREVWKIKIKIKL